MRYPLTDCDRLVFGLPLEVLAHLQGLFLCNGESAAGSLLDEALVHIRHDLLESCAVESLGENRSPANNVLSSFHFLSVAIQHFSFD